MDTTKDTTSTTSAPAAKATSKATTPRKAATKTTAKAPAKKVTKAAPTVRMTPDLYATDKGGPYTALRPNDLFRGYTIASLIAAGYITQPTKAGAVKATGKGNAAILWHLIGSAKRVWGGFIDGGRISAKGVNKVQNSLNPDPVAGESHYKTTTDVVTAILAGIRSGGKVDIPTKDGKHTVQFASVVSVKA